VILGTTAKKSKKLANKEIQIPVYSILVHPEYNPEDGLNDIALLGLSMKVEYTSIVLL